MVGRYLEEKKKVEEIRNWMKVLLTNKYFVPCCSHINSKKNESNKFCIDCKQSLCQLCLSSSTNSHSLHQVLQIRKYVYEDVVRIKDMNLYFNCAKIKHYMNNGSRVVFLNSREVVKPIKSYGGPFCENCDRSLGEPHRYCSIACKLAVSKTDHHLFPALSQELCGLSPDENHESESDMKENDSSDSLHAEAEWTMGSPPPFHNFYLNRSPSFRSVCRAMKRKGFPCRAPCF